MVPYKRKRQDPSYFASSLHHSSRKSQLWSTLLAQRPRKSNWRCINPLEFRGNYSATSNNMKLVHWPLMRGLLHLVRWKGDGRAAVYQSPYCCVMVRCSSVWMRPLKGFGSLLITVDLSWLSFAVVGLLFAADVTHTHTHTHTHQVDDVILINHGRTCADCGVGGWRRCFPSQHVVCRRNAPALSVDFHQILWCLCVYALPPSIHATAHCHYKPLVGVRVRRFCISLRLCRVAPGLL